ncbi:hypothetical protein FRB93_005759 [Tulasnella sp. JGI-2019a]|nr:hypothetical protein FRB93_005759 [Tulasnella sp. JGI-2019a]
MEEEPQEPTQSRILIIGKANAGKTSILKKICGESVPIVLDRDGNPVTDHNTLDPTLARGMHDIEYEIIYPSRPGFSFYDSRGIESGSTEELDKVADFITRRSIAPLEERLHATWVCLSLDDERPVGEAELRMLGVKNPREIPVVVVFTKYDGLETRALNTLRREGFLKPREAFRAMAATAEGLFKEHWLNRIYTTEPPKPPYVRLKDLDKPQGKCDDLLDCTADMLRENRPAQKIFVLAQSYSPEKRLKYATEDIVGYLVETKDYQGEVPGEAVRRFLSWMPHVYMRQEVTSPHLPPQSDVRAAAIYL